MAGWGVLALYYFDHESAAVRTSFAAAFAVVSAAALAGFVRGRWRWRELALYLALFCTTTKQVRVRASIEPRGIGSEEKETIPDNRPANRASNFVPCVGLLVILDVRDGCIVEWAQHQTLNRFRSNRTTVKIVMRFAPERVAARFRDGADQRRSRRRG